MTLINIISETPTKELKRAFNSDKGYIKINVSVFNAGAAIHFNLTDNFKQINPNTWNGYDSIHENDNLMQEIIKNELEKRGVITLEHINGQCYYKFT